MGGQDNCKGVQVVRNLLEEERSLHFKELEVQSCNNEACTHTTAVSMHLL